jgi:hypothetical protein
VAGEFTIRPATIFDMSGSMIPMRRLHLFEIHEQSWCPGFIRDFLTEWLRVLWEFSKAPEVIAPKLADIAGRLDSPLFVDLCSGSGGPWQSLRSVLWRNHGCSAQVTLTDKFPTGQAIAVSATDVPPELTGFRTLFNAFHHFRPEQARAILRDAHDKRQPIAVFELTERIPAKVALCAIASFLSVFPALLLMKSRPSWWLFTWLLPIIPLVVAWDSLVSHLRSYTASELVDMTSGLESGYTWEATRLTARGFDVTCLIGCPPLAESKAASTRQETFSRPPSRHAA